MRRGALTAAVVAALAALAAPAPARADRPSAAAAVDAEAPSAGGAAAQAIADALAARRLSEAYRLAAEAVTTTPDDADLRYQAAEVALVTLRLDEVDEHVAAGLRVRPGDADLLGLRAYVQLLRGDHDAARASVMQALAIDPEADRAQQTFSALVVIGTAVARLEGADPGLPAGTPAAFVDALIARFAAGAPALELARSFDVRILDGAPAGERSELALVRRVSGVRELARAQRVAEDQRWLGWVVSPEGLVEGDRRFVDVTVVAQQRYTRGHAELIRAALDDPEIARVVDPNTLALVTSVEPAERAALLDRMVGYSNTVQVPVQIELVPAGSSWRVIDVVVNGVSLRRDAATLTRVGEVIDPSGRDDRSAAYRAGYAVGKVLAPLLLVGVVLLIARRASRKRLR